MSQTQDYSGVSPAFRNTPTNPNLRAAALQQAAAQDPAPVLAQQISPATDSAPAANPLPAVPTAAAPSTSTSSQPAAGAVQPPAPAAAPAPAYQPDWAAVVAEQHRARELEMRNAEMARRLKEQDDAINNLLHIQQEYADLKRQQQLQQEAAAIDYNELATIDPGEAKLISEGVLKAVQAKIEPLQRELAQQRAQLQQAAQYQEQRFERQRAQSTLEKVMARHPDFLTLQNDPAFAAFMQQRDGLSSQTLDTRAAAEFKLGNAEYVSYLVDQYKQSQPTTASIAAVAPVQTATATPSATQGTQAQLTLHELNSLMQTGQITSDEYREQLQRIKASGQFY